MNELAISRVRAFCVLPMLTRFAALSIFYHSRLAFLRARRLWQAVPAGPPAEPCFWRENWVPFEQRQPPGRSMSVGGWWEAGKRSSERYAGFALKESLEMKVSFLPAATYGVRAVYDAGWPSPPRLFEPGAGRQMMEEMLEQAAFADELGFDWISFSEHHYAPLLVLTPNPFIFAAAAIRHIRRAKIALFGPILPLHNPIHVAEEIAMLDVLSAGRLLLLFLRGVPYELRAFSVNLEDARAMTQEATLLITRALTDPQPFSWEGRYYRYPTVSVWPGLLQRPHPPLYSTGNSFASATFAASHGHGLALSFAPLSYVAEVIPHYRAEAVRHGWEPREDQVIFRGNLLATDTDEEGQRLAVQLASLPHLQRPQSPPAAISGRGGERDDSPAAPVLLNQAQFCGSPQTLVAQMEALYNLGVGVVDLVVPTGLMSQAQVLHSLELLAREVLPRVHALGGA